MNAQAPIFFDLPISQLVTLSSPPPPLVSAAPQSPPPRQPLPEFQAVFLPAYCLPVVPLAAVRALRPPLWPRRLRVFLSLEPRCISIYININTSINISILTLIIIAAAAAAAEVAPEVPASPPVLALRGPQSRSLAPRRLLSRPPRLWLLLLG